MASFDNSFSDSIKTDLKQFLKVGREARKAQKGQDIEHMLPNAIETCDLMENIRGVGKDELISLLITLANMPNGYLKYYNFSVLLRSKERVGVTSLLLAVKMLIAQGELEAANAEVDAWIKEHPTANDDEFLKQYGQYMRVNLPRMRALEAFETARRNYVESAPIACETPASVFMQSAQ
jgi:hypothetical protein